MVHVIERRDVERKTTAATGRRPFWTQLWFWVFIAIVLGAVDPRLGVQMAPLGTEFIKLITMFIGPLIFCTMISGMARTANVNRLGAVALKTFLIFQAMVTIAMLIAFVSMDVLRPGEGLDPFGLAARRRASTTMLTRLTRCASCRSSWI